MTEPVLTRRERLMVERLHRDLELLAKVAAKLPEALRRAHEDAVGVRAQNYDSVTVRAGGRHSDPTALTALRDPDPVTQARDRIALAVLQLDRCASELVYAVAETERQCSSGTWNSR